MNNDPPKPAAPTKKPRSPGEKLVVWGGIVVLLLLAAVQAHARFGYEMSLKKLQARVASDDNGTVDGAPLYLSDVPTYLVGWPSRKVEEERHWHAVTYSWVGLGKSYSIRMPYDTTEAKPVILSLETNDAPPEPEPEAVAATEDAHSGASIPSITPMGGSGGPGGGGGPRPDIMESDKDSDGKVSREEAADRPDDVFTRMDANSDGFIDADEAAAARARRAARAAAGGGPGGAPGGRPQAEGDAPAETPADAEGAVKAVATEAAAAPAAEEKPAP